VLPASTPTERTRRENQIFTATIAASSGNVHHFGPRCGVMISWTACNPTHPAMAKTKTATARPATASALPCP
jgi:hypothetical protein